MQHRKVGAEWNDRATIDEYAAKAMDPVVGWYEYEVNFPDLLQLFPSGTRKVIDYGCGPGEFTFELTKHFPVVVGVDMEQMISVAQSKFPNIHFTKISDGGGFPEEVMNADVIFSKLTLQFVQDLVSLARSFFMGLGKSGCVIFSVPHPHKVALEYDLNPDVTTPYTDYIGDTGIEIHPINRSRNDYIEIFESAGFALVDESEPMIPEELVIKYNKPNGPYSSRLNMKFQKVAE